MTEHDEGQGKNDEPAEQGLSTQELVERLYDHLRELAGKRMVREGAGHTLQPTALVHEAYMRLGENGPWTSEDEFIAYAVTVFRNALVDHARAKKRQKRGGGAIRITLVPGAIAGDRREIDILELDDCLTHLATLSQRHARIVELRFFGELSVDRTAEILNISPSTVQREWRWARAWLLRELGDHEPGVD